MRIRLAYCVAALAACLAATTAFAAETAETWLFNGSTEGWTASSGTSISSTSGFLHVVFATGGGIYTPIINYIPGSDTYHRDYVRFGYQIPSSSFTQLKFNFSTNSRNNFSSPDRFLTGLIRDGGWHYATFRVDDIGDWKTSSRITQLRFVAVVAGGGGASGTLNLDFVALREDDKLPMLYDAACSDATQIVSVSPATWTSGPIVVTVKGNDPPPYGFAVCTTTPPDEYGSGVASFRYTVNGVTTTQTFDDQDAQWPSGWSQAPITILAGSLPTGSHTFSVHALDRVGFQSTTNTSTMVYYDGTPPGRPDVTSISPSTWTNVASFAFAWTNPGDTGSGVDGYEYLIDGVDGPFPAPVTSVTGVTVSASGDHVFQARAVDTAGNPGQWSAGASFHYDADPPAPPGSIRMSPEGYTNQNAFGASWGAGSDAHSGVAGYEYRVNGGQIQFTPNTSTAGLLAGREGANDFEVRTVDNVGNRSGWGAANFYYYPGWLFPPVPLSPTAGAAIVLPETFSWTPVSGAAGYEIQVSPDPSFSSSAWSTQTTASTSVVVPPAAAAAVGSGYAWRVRALGSDPPGNWSQVSTFIRVTAVLPPAPPSLVAPPNEATLAGTQIAFQWNVVGAASTYRLDVSASSDFVSGSGTFSLDGITTTTRVVTVSAAASDLFWRVTAANSGAAGSPSEVWHIHLVPAAGGLTSASVISPGANLTVPVGEALVATGLIVGRALGSVQLDWIMDGETFASGSMPATGEGGETDPVAIPTTIEGAHSLQLRATGSTQVLSPPRTINVVPAVFGTADHFALVADQPQLLVGAATSVYATVRDEAGQLVLTDQARAVLFTVDGDGMVVPEQAVTSSGVAVTSYAAGANESTPQLQVVDAPSSAFTRASGYTPVRPAYCAVGISNSELTRQKQIAIGYLNHLSALSWRGVPEVGQVPNAYAPVSFQNLAPIYAWVNGSSSTLPALRRLNLYLRFVDRSFFYDEAFTPVGERENKGRVYGAATLYADQAFSMGQMGATVLALALDLIAEAAQIDPAKGSTKAARTALKNLKKGIETASQAIVVGTDFAVSMAINLSGASKAEKQGLRETWQVMKTLLDATVASADGSIDYVINHSGLLNRMAQRNLDRQYRQPMETQLRRVFDAVRQPGWDGGSDDKAAAWVDWGINEIRNKSATYHCDCIKTIGAFDFEALISDAEGLLRYFNPAFLAGQILNKAIKTSVIWAVGADCGIIGQRIPALASTIADKVIVPYYPGPSAIVLPPNGLGPTRAKTTRGSSFVRLASTDQERSGRFVAYEAQARALETSLDASDTLAVDESVDSVDVAETGLTDATQSLFAPLLSTVDAARASIDGFEAGGDSLAARAQDAAMLRLLAIASARDWLANPADSTRLAAIGQIRQAIEATSALYDAGSSYSAAVLGLPGEPFLFLSHPTAPAEVYAGAGITVNAHVANLGTGAATAPGFVLTCGDSTMGFLAEPLPSADDLVAGDSRDLSWRVRFSPAFAESDSVTIVALCVAPDSASDVGNSQTLPLHVRRNPGTLGVRPSSPALLAVRGPQPNPAHGHGEFLVTVPFATPAVLEFVDVGGRRIRKFELGRVQPGAHRVDWDFTGEDGRPVAPGVYFARVRTGVGNRSIRFTILK